MKETIDKIAMYWGYFSFIGMIIIFLYCIPFAHKDEADTPYQKRKKYFEKKKREYEGN